MSSPFLSASEKNRGLKHHYRHQLLNGIGFNFLGDTPVYLLALYFGASNTELGFISSVLYVAGILLSITPRLLAGKDIVKIQYLAWLIRGFLCLSYAALFFLQGRAAVWLILITYTLFCSSRIVGASMYQPLIRMISTTRNRGNVLAGSSLRFQISATLSKVISFAVTSLKQLGGVSGILFMTLGGVIINTLAALEIKKIPCREKVRYKKGRNVFVIFLESVKVKNLRQRILLSIINAGLIVIFGFAVPFLRNDAGFSNSEVFLVTVTAGVATIASAYFSKGFADRLGSRPLIIWVIVLLTAASLLWALLPYTPYKAVYYFALFLSTFFLRANDLLVNRLIVGSMPENDSVGFSSMLNFFIAFFALIIGLTGGKLADFSKSSDSFAAVNGYSFTFIFAAVLCLFSLFISLRIKESGSISPAEAAAIIFSPSNLSTYQSISKLDSTENAIQRKTLLMNIGLNNSKMATDEIRNILSSPLSSDKGELITSLYTNHRPILLPELLHEAEEPYSYHRLKAIFALGAYPSVETQELLLRLLDDPDPAVVSNAAKSLGRIGCTTAYDKVKKLAASPTTIWNTLNFIIAMYHLDTEGEYLNDIFSEDKTVNGDAFNQTVYSLYANLYQMEPPLSVIFQERNMMKGQGLRDFLDEAREEEKFLHNHRNFLEWFRDDELENIWNLCKDILQPKTVPDYYSGIKKSIIKFPSDKGAYDDALAAVYFTYQLLKM